MRNEEFSETQQDAARLGTLPAEDSEEWDGTEQGTSFKRTLSCISLMLRNFHLLKDWFVWQEFKRT